jgi:hypothetical protein
MAFNMTLPMVLWMRYRGHSWERSGEMAAAMNLPLTPLLVLYALDLIPAQAVLGLQMMLMIPAMVLAMLYRKEEYSAAHQRTWHRYRRRWFAGAHQLARMPVALAAGHELKFGRQATWRRVRRSSGCLDPADEDASR